MLSTIVYPWSSNANRQIAMSNYASHEFGFNAFFHLKKTMHLQKHHFWKAIITKLGMITSGHHSQVVYSSKLLRVDGPGFKCRWRHVLFLRLWTKLKPYCLLQYIVINSYGCVWPMHCVSWPALGCLSSVYLYRLLGASVSTLISYHDNPDQVWSHLLTTH